MEELQDGMEWMMRRCEGNELANIGDGSRRRLKVKETGNTAYNSRTLRPGEKNTTTDENVAK